jgi:hypothetical protein
VVQAIEVRSASLVEPFDCDGVASITGRRERPRWFVERCREATCMGVICRRLRDAFVNARLSAPMTSQRQRLRHSLLALTRANCLGIGAMLALLREFDGADSGRPMLSGVLTDEGRLKLAMCSAKTTLQLTFGTPRLSEWIAYQEGP